jgi:hypothetical protein
MHGAYFSRRAYGGNGITQSNEGTEDERCGCARPQAGEAGLARDGKSAANTNNADLMFVLAALFSSRGPLRGPVAHHSLLVSVAPFLCVKPFPPPAPFAA